MTSRFNVVGTSGSGKSTFSKKLANRLDISRVEMDAVFWKPDWQESTDEEFFSELEDKLKGDAWVLDGNYSRTTPVKWKKVQTVIWLDYSFQRTFMQAFKRAVTRIWRREEIWEGTGNRESFFRTFLSKESVLFWTITSYQKVKKGYESVISDDRFAHISFVRIRSPKEADSYLRKFAD